LDCPAKCKAEKEMSFDHNPYKHVELIQSDEDSNLWFWHCHSCGADGNRTGLVSELPLSETQVIIDDFYAHIRKSHGRNEEDFASWSKW
jgi:hypothetical protein